jgi:anti-sigma factor RsiW
VAREHDFGGAVKQCCTDVIPLLGAWLDRELASEDAALVEGHVMACPACSDRMAVLAAQAEALRVTMVARAGSVDLSGLAHAVLAQASRSEVRAKFLRRPIAAALAIAAAVAGIAVSLRTVTRAVPQTLAPVQVASIDEVDFRAGQGFVLQSGPTSIIWFRDAAVAR